jgi:prepilin-type N-terminal cleavage/methylation domain-containing protein
MKVSLRAHHPSRRDGFTILELLTVMIIVGVVAAISAGKMHDIMLEQRVTRASTAVQNDLEAAFSIAARNRRPVRITWDAASMQLQVTDRLATTYYRRLGLGLDPYGFRSGNVTVSTSPIEIYPNGLANDELLVVFSANNVTKQVRMSRSGLVKVTK